MCGRYTLADPNRVAEQMLRDFGVIIAAEAPRYNVAPSQVVPIIHANERGELVSQEMRWGLVPFWDTAEKPKIAPINVRSEEAFGKPMFRQCLQHRRALFPADGFFEWQAAAHPGGKTPFRIGLAEGAPFVIAGIYETATTLRPSPTCALLTTAPNSLISLIHNRMPVIMEAAVARRWLRPGPISEAEYAGFCVSFPAEAMAAHPVSTLVNNVRNNGPELIVPWQSG